MLLLTAAEHLRASTDNSYILTHYRQVLDRRSNSSEKLTATFEDLLSVLRIEAGQHRGVDSRMESSLLSPLDRLDSSDEDSDSTFEDAQENL